MSKASLVARGGLLIAVSVVLLYVACIFPMARVSAAAGIVPAIPLQQHRVRLAVSIYFAVGLLAVLLLPLKMVAFLYIWMFGLYTIAKHGIEIGKNIRLQWIGKLSFAAVDLGVGFWILQKGFFGSLTLLTQWSIWPLLLGGCGLFLLYDIAFSKLIEGLRRIFPTE